MGKLNTSVASVISMLTILTDNKWYSIWLYQYLRQYPINMFTVTTVSFLEGRFKFRLIFRSWVQLAHGFLRIFYLREYAVWRLSLIWHARLTSVKLEKENFFCLGKCKVDTVGILIRWLIYHTPSPSSLTQKENSKIYTWGTIIKQYRNWRKLMSILFSSLSNMPARVSMLAENMTLL